MGESGRDFGLKVMIKFKLKLKKKIQKKLQLLNMIVPHLLYGNSYHFASSLRKLCFREQHFFRDISVTVLRIV